jgi:ABC-2 type transport system permease protein
MLTLLAATFRLQGRIMLSSRDYWIDLVRAPLLAVVLLALIRHDGRPDLVANGLLAPVLMAVWSMALLVSGEIIDADRWLGTLESLVAAPASFSRVVGGRVLVTTAISLTTAVEVWLVAVAGFGITPQVHHPWVFLAALAATAAATACAASLMAALFVATRTARTFQNSLSYPFLLLGGVFVPLDSLPGWTHPIGRLVYLSWSSDLLRDALEPAAVAGVARRLCVILGLGAALWLIGRLTLRRVLRLVREAGTLGLR